MNFLKYVNLATELAGILLAPPIVGVLLGRWLDQMQGHGSGWTFGLLILGIITGLWSMAKHLRGISS